MRQDDVSLVICIQTKPGLSLRAAEHFQDSKCKKTTDMMRLHSFDELHSTLGLKPVAFLWCSKALSNIEGVDKAHQAVDLASL